ncbi:PIN domain-containing protein [Thiothrix winogradskyi]|uniref:PIN domain-containing protein n=1 Tax=Thiothrix winogradskyi TaxID=96472 RepID=A0ABY3SUF9_9GAMM|nr:PIN domain-containing protein [Thiothrix winogradskyi]UJS22818.1 PIN domain-containing protein [Thiothrix winogradskyi]
MKRYLLDTSALLTLRDDEEGADVVADILQQCQYGRVKCFACFMSQMEILYRVWKNEGEQVGRLAYEQCKSLPIEWVHESSELLEKAAQLKATCRVSLADAWIAASALLHGATLVHKDPEFETVQCQQLALPYKQTKIHENQGEYQLPT